MGNPHFAIIFAITPISGSMQIQVAVAVWRCLHVLEVEGHTKTHLWHRFFTIPSQTDVALFFKVKFYKKWFCFLDQFIVTEIWRPLHGVITSANALCLIAKYKMVSILLNFIRYLLLYFFLMLTIRQGALFFKRPVISKRPWYCRKKHMMTVLHKIYLV